MKPQVQTETAAETVTEMATEADTETAMVSDQSLTPY